MRWNSLLKPLATPVETIHTNPKRKRGGQSQFSLTLRVSISLTLRVGICCLLAASLAITGCGGHSADPNTSTGTEQSNSETVDAATPPDDPRQMARKQLQGLIDDTLARLAEIKDYRYTLRKQEMVDDVLLDPQYLATKIRHEPFSVYLKFVEPSPQKGTEAMYVEGRNDGKLIGHGTGIKAILGTQHLDPKGMIAMLGNRYPIVDSGMKNTLNKLKRMANDPVSADCQIEFIEAGEVGGRPCYGVQLTNDEPNDKFKLAKARLLFDNETRLLARFSAWHWLPSGPREPQLVEDYTYTDVMLNCDFDDADFDPKNPEYGYPR